MIMPRGEQLLLPASPWFIGLSLFLALVVNLLPTSNWIWMPDLLLLVLAFWGIHQPQHQHPQAKALCFGLGVEAAKI